MHVKADRAQPQALPQAAPLGGPLAPASLRLGHIRSDLLSSMIFVGALHSEEPPAQTADSLPQLQPQAATRC